MKSIALIFTSTVHIFTKQMLYKHYLRLFRNTFVKMLQLKKFHHHIIGSPVVTGCSIFDYLSQTAADYLLKHKCYETRWIHLGKLV